VNEAAALVALAAILAAAVARPRWAPDWVVAVGTALLLLAGGTLSANDVRHELARLGPTVGFLAALLVLAAECGRAGVFDALGEKMALRAHGRPRRLLAMVFAAAAATTAVLSLDATVVLLTPVVFATAARVRTSPRPYVYACSHLANSASLLLPVSNLTNLLAFQATHVSFARFAELMVLPWLAALALEWAGLTRTFRPGLSRPSPDRSQTPSEGSSRLPRLPLVVLILTLAGFASSSPIGISPAWFAAAGALVLAARNRTSAPKLVGSAAPTFLLFVLGLGVVVHAASMHGLSSAIDSLLPRGTALPALLAVAAVSAVLANLVNNLPATLIVLPVATAGGPAAVLAMLVGVNAGPNLTYTGSLATLLWRRVMRAHEEAVDLRQFTRLGLLTVPPVLAASTIALWFALRVS
jgi:arsenical pump membrane protein